MPAVKLPIGAVLAEAYGGFFANLRLFFHVVTLPWIFSLGLRLLGAAVASDSMIAVLLEKLVDVVPTVMFMAAWQRIVLLGPGRLERLPGLGWSAREQAWLVHLAKIAAVPFVLVALFILAVGSIDTEMLRPGAPIDPETAQRQAFAAPIGAGFTLSMLLALRVSWGLAGTAVDLPFSPRQSWAYSRGNAWAIVGMMFLTLFVSAMATAFATIVTHVVMRGVLGADLAAAVVTWTVGLLVSYAGAGLAASVQAVVFRRLLSWREGAPLPPLER